MTTDQPRRPDSRSYMSGWFKVQYKGDRAKVRSALARHFNEEPNEEPTQCNDQTNTALPTPVSSEVAALLGC